MADHASREVQPAWLREWAYTPLTILYMCAVGSVPVCLVSVAVFFLFRA